MATGTRAEDAGGHQRAPEVDVGPDQVADDADRHRLHLAGAHEDEGVEELVPAEGEAEDAGREDAGHAPAAGRSAHIACRRVAPSTRAASSSSREMVRK